MGRGEGALQSVSRTQPGLDQGPRQESWHKLPGVRNHWVSVEAAPRHFEHEEGWKYRAVIAKRHSTHHATPVMEATGDSAQDALYSVVESFLSDGRRKYVIPPEKISRLLEKKVPTGPVEKSAEHRLKDIPHPLAKRYFSLQAREICEEDPDEVVSYREATRQGDRWAQRPNKRFEYEIGTFSSQEGGWESVRVDSDAEEYCEELFVVVRTYDEGDTFGMSYNKKDFLFAFQTEEAAREWLDYRQTLPSFHYWGRSERFNIERALRE